jgi:hypothetical protein
MKVIVHKALFYTLLFCVYGIFFSVESFYNFEGQPYQKLIFQHEADSGPVLKSQALVKCAPLHSTSSHSIRLNKRYHQENIPPCTIFSLAAPERYITPVRLGLPGDGVLPSVAIIHYSLRGPPADA